jgi:hypothetical protein
VYINDMAISSTQQTYQGIAVGAFGSTIITGTAIYTGNWAAIRTLDSSFTFSGATRTSNVTNDSYFSGKTFSVPAEIVGNFTGIQLSSGSCIAIKGI